MGELSARFVPAAKSWVLLYQRRLAPGRRGQGVFARFAATPTGPWSDELPLLEPDVKTATGFGAFMHGATSTAGFCDGLANPGREDEWGDPYGPYLVPEWCYTDGDGLHLVHTLSTWNPYQSFLMDAVVSPRGASPATAPTSAPAPHDLRRLALPSRLASTGSAVRRRTIVGVDWLWLMKGASGQTARWKVAPAQRWLTLRLRGAGTVARLADGSGHTVRESRSPAEAGSELEVRWRIDPFEGQLVSLRLDVRPSDADGGGFTQPALLAAP